MKKFILGFLVGALLFSAIPISAAVKEYILTPTTTKLVVDGQEVKDEKAPMLYLSPGYNYIPAATFRSICDKIGVEFEWDGAVQEIRLTTNIESTTNTENKVISEVPLNKYGLPDFSNYKGEKPAIEDDGKNQYFTYEGVRYIRLGWDKNHLPMIERPYYLWNPIVDDDDNRKITLTKVVETSEGEESITLLQEIPYTLYSSGTYYYITYDYFTDTFLPAIAE